MNDNEMTLEEQLAALDAEAVELTPGRRLAARNGHGVNGNLLGDHDSGTAPVPSSVRLEDDQATADSETTVEPPADSEKHQPCPISFGEEQATRSMKALCTELPYLLERRPYIAIRAVNYLDDKQYKPRNGVYSQNGIQDLITDVVKLND